MRAFIGPENLKIILVILFFTVLFEQSGVLIILPVLPDLLYEITGSDVADTAQIGGFLSASYALMQLIFGPIIGKLSDHYGRRKILVISSFVFIFDYLIMAFATELWVLFLGRILAGITGACLVTGLACVADISSPESKTKNYAFIYAALGLGLIVGPIISSISVRIGLAFHLGVRAPFFFASMFALVNFLVILFFMPETLAENKRNKFKVESPFKPIVKFSQYPGLKKMFLSHFIFMIAVQAPFVLTSFFVKEKLKWDPVQTADLFIWIGVVMIVVQLVAVPKLYPKLGNINICYLGMILFALGMLMMVFVNNTGILYFASALFGCSMISNSAYSSLYTSQVKENEQGELQGVISSFVSLATIIGLLFMTDLFKFSVEQDILLRESNPFLVATFLTLISFVYLISAFNKLEHKL
ncbi:MAG: MFS transporter [Neisseriaceae bacterium]|nr:MAG: MFS transporter [Neisseriaceae bacterium]